PKSQSHFQAEPTMNKKRIQVSLLATMLLLRLAGTSTAQTLPSESPQDFKPTNYGLEYERRDVIIPMRDGVKLHTVVIVPKSVIEARSMRRCCLLARRITRPN